MLDCGCDRFVVESLLYSQPRALTDIANMIGVQALIASLPVRVQEGQLVVQHVDPEAGVRQDAPIPGEAVSGWLDKLPVSEVLIIDAAHEGHYGQFSLLPFAEQLGSFSKGVIWFGGLGADQAVPLLQLEQTVAVAFGNVNFERELFIHHVRSQVTKQTGDDLVRRSVPV